MKSTADLNSTPKAKVRGLRILSISMMAGVTFFAGVILFINRSALPPMAAEAARYRYEILGILLAAAGLAVYISKIRWDKKMQQARETTGGLDMKLDIYKVALLKYMSLCELPALLSVIVFFLTGQQLFLLVAGVQLIFMGLKLFSINKLPEELQLSWQESELLK